MGGDVTREAGLHKEDEQNQESEPVSSVPPCSLPLLLLELLSWLPQIIGQKQDTSTKERPPSPVGFQSVFHHSNRKQTRTHSKTPCLLLSPNWENFLILTSLSRPPISMR